MSYSTAPGHIGWVDLTVADASGLRDFYASVAGWRPEPVEMPTHVDYNMTAGDEDDPIAGVCHALGENAELPPAWLVYINVIDLTAALANAEAMGGSIVAGPRGQPGSMQFAVLRDPAGAAFALVQHGPT